MNEQPKNPNEPKLSDDQMDGLLSSFFQNETPDQLKQLPSTWGAIRNDENAPAVVPQKSPSRYQRLLVVGTSLAAACLLAVAANSFLPSPIADTGTAIVEEVDDSKLVLDQDATLNVSSNSDDQAIDDVNTSLEEIDMIDLSPQANDDDGQQLDIKL